MKKNWLVVYTKSQCEIKVAALLTKKKVENYCPLTRLVSSQTNKKKIIEEPLFPSFVFVLATEIEIPLIRQVSHVIDFVYWLGSPVIVQAEEIESLNLFISRYHNIKLEKAHVATNATVRYIGVPTANSNAGTFSALNSEYRMSLPSLGYVLVADIEQPSANEFNYGVQKSNWFHN